MGTTERDEVSTALGKAITIRRVELGLSRNDLRDRSGLSYPYVAELERGLKSPSSKALESIATALEMRPHELLARAEQLLDEPATPSMAPPLPQSRSVTRPPAPAAGAAPPPPEAEVPAAAPRAARRWFGPAAAPVARPPTAGAPPTSGTPARKRARRPLASGPPPELTEDRVREIVREELRRLVTGEAD